MSLISFFPSRAVVAMALLALTGPAPVSATQQDPADLARRIADIASIALDEYATGVQDGQVVLPEELAEAQLFLGEAERLAQELPPDVRTSVLAYLARMTAGVARLADVAPLRLELAGLRTTLETAVGVALDPMPRAAPSLARGAELYRGYCAQCHGETGAGDGPMAAGLEPPPADLTDRAALRGTAPVDLFRKINVGVAGTAMPGFSDRFDLDDRWALALYSATLRFPPGAARAARARMESCPACRLWAGDFATTATMSDDSLAVALRHTLTGASDSVSWDLVAYARSAAAAELDGNNSRLAIARAIGATRRTLAEVESLATLGEMASANRRALDAYLMFERVEATVRARSAAAAARVERSFAALRGALSGGSPRWRGHLADAGAALDAAQAEATATASLSVLFGQSLVIMLREGIEAILIIGVLTAVVVKAGAPEGKREIGWGVLAALGASVVTAIAFATVFRAAMASQEALEGWTMLLASLVLFMVSYWLVSKIEVKKWMAFVRSQVSEALSSGRVWALAGVAFLAVYREGFETVLFYGALFSTTENAPSASGAIVLGMVLGVLGLVFVYVAMHRFGLRLPLKPFFAVTSTLLYVMAFSFAGQGVAALQAAGVIPVTPLEWLPALPMLGIFPTTQTVLSQLVLAVALIGALIWVFWLEPRVGEQATA